MKRYSLNKSFHPENPTFLPISAVLIFYVLFSISNSYSQQPTQEWVARITGPTNDDRFGPFLEVDKLGNSYVAGCLVVNDTPKVLCVKYNTDGVQQWSSLYVYPIEAYIRPAGLALDSNGNAYVIAEQGPAYDLPHNGLIVRFNNSNGSPDWVKRYIGQYGWGPFRDIKIDRLNNIFVVGWTDSSHLVIRYNTNGDSVWVRKNKAPWLVREVTRACTIDDSSNVIFTGQRRFYYPPFGYYDSLLVGKYSSTGILRWESVYAYNLLGSDIGTKITYDQNGNVFIGGVSTVSGYSVYLTIRYDRNGIRQWSKIYNPPSSILNDIYGIVLDRVNNQLYVTGYSSVNSLGSSATIKYNVSTGDTAWVRRGFGVAGNSSAWDIDVDSIGNPIIAGSSIGMSNSDLSTLKYNPNGNQDWMIRYNGQFNGIDGARTLEVHHNYVYVLGKSQSSSQISDYVIIKYNRLSGLNPISNNIPLSFNLQQNFPNPFNPNTKIRFSVSKNSVIQLKIYDVLGRIKEILVNEKLIPSEYEVTFEAPNYSSGVYFYQLTSDGNIIDTKKLVIIK